MKWTLPFQSSAIIIVGSNTVIMIITINIIVIIMIIIKIKINNNKTLKLSLQAAAMAAPKSGLLADKVVICMMVVVIKIMRMLALMIKIKRMMVMMINIMRMITMMIKIIHEDDGFDDDDDVLHVEMRRCASYGCHLECHHQLPRRETACNCWSPPNAQI